MYDGYSKLPVGCVINRGVAMASQMPSRILKKECAQILEGMKVKKGLCTCKISDHLHML